MAQINRYANKTAYNADSTRSKTKSAVSFVSENNEQIFDGVNIVVDKNAASEGDLVVFDKVLLRNRFIKAKTVVKAQIPSTLHPHSVVIGWRGDKVLFTPLVNAGSARWAHSFECRIKNVVTTSSGTLSVSVKGGSTTETAQVSWSSGTALSTIASNLATALTGLSQEYNQKWSVSVDGSDIIMSHNYRASSTVMGVTGTGGGYNVSYVQDDKDYQVTYAYITATEQVQRKNGVSSYYAGMNKRKFYDYYRVNGTDATGKGLHSSTILKESAFTEAANPIVYNEYKGDYRAYLYGEHMAQYPAVTGAHARKGIDNTAWLNAQRGTPVRGANEPRYPAASMVAEFGISLDGYVTGLEAGAFWLPDVEEMMLMMRDRRLNSGDTATEDPVNDTLVKMGGNTMYGSGYYPWTSSEYSSDGAFIFYGNDGRVGYDTKYTSRSVRPVSAL